uniref:Uncharacterized protein n=2 Tax=Chenopodium quinoa TaxID=63459 RepID=A0A803L129_CHEQI
MSTPYFPLSWESTGDQWWYATPIDWAAANGLCDLVKELLRIDPNLLIKLTSLRRIRRLETVWEDSLEAEACPHDEVAHCRARVACALLMDCEPSHGDRLQHNSLMRAGYGGWLLYTAASAGDMEFVKNLLERDPLLVVGEGEYGVTDILYAAARSKNSEVFRLLLDSAMNVNKGSDELGEDFVGEMMNRAVHAAARGGNLEILKELLLDCSDVSGYRDGQGSTILHSASGRGQFEVVKDLIATYSSIISSTDNQGNTALHTAAYRGYTAVVEVLVLESPSLATSRNNDGNTFLHMAVAGFQSPGFHRITQQLQLIKWLASGEIVSLEDIINIRNKVGRTAMHVAVAENIQCNVVELLMRVPSIDLNIRDIDELTPLDLLKQCPNTASSNILIKPFTSAGGISDCQDFTTRSALARQLRIQGIGTSPGTSFRLPDAELFPYAGDGNDSEVTCEPPSSRFSSCSSEVTSHFGLESNKKASKWLNFLRRPDKIEMCPTTQIESPNPHHKLASTKVEEHNDVGMFKVCRNVDESITPLRQKFSRAAPSPSAREKFTASLMQGVVQATPPRSCLSLARYSPSSSISESLTSSPTAVDKLRGDYDRKSPGRSSFFSGPLSGGKPLVGEKHRRVSSFNKSLMNQYFCFGAQGLAVEDSLAVKRTNSSCRRLVF